MENHDLNPVPDGEKVAEMACTCVFALVVVVIIITTILMLLSK